MQKDATKLVMNHPGLLKSDHRRIEKLMEDQKEKKIYWGAFGFGMTMLVYNIGFKSNWMFYNFFRK